MSFRKPAHEIGGPWNATLPVHENMTLLALKRALEAGQKKSSSYKGGILLSGVDLKELPTGEGKDYVDPKDAPLSTQEFLRGVTWPDDPKGWLFDTARGTTNYSSGKWWYDEFKDGNIKNDEHLIKRSHYGDLQFFHSMAVERNERAATTKDKVMEWARFNVKLALGKVDFKTRIENLPVRFSSLQLFFRGHCAWEIRALLAASCFTCSRTRTPTATSSARRTEPFSSFMTTAHRMARSTRRRTTWAPGRPWPSA